MNRCVRVSSSVDLVPRRAATSACTRSSSCSASALKSSSDFANAHVSFPVAGLVFVGGLTPNFLSTSANFGLLISSSLVIPASINNVSFLSFTSSRCCSSKPRSSSSLGWINIRRVRSISLSSFFGKSLPIIRNNL